MIAHISFATKLFKRNRCLRTWKGGAVAQSVERWILTPTTRVPVPENALVLQKATRIPPSRGQTGISKACPSYTMSMWYGI